jgi:hypothetical protein
MAEEEEEEEALLIAGAADAGRGLFAAVVALAAVAEGGAMPNLRCRWREVRGRWEGA